MNNDQTTSDYLHRRPRGFAATTTAPTRGGKKERESEKERTKLRERHRRAITSRMLAGLRQYGNYPLPARADINDVLSALARQAGWTVLPDGSTFRDSSSSTSTSTPPALFSVRPAGSSPSNCSLRKCSANASLDCQPSLFKFDENLSPASLDSIIVSERDTNSEKYTSTSPDNSSECLGNDQLMHVIGSKEHGNDFAGSPYVPVYVSFANGVINKFCQLVNPEGIRQELRHLKSLQVDGVVVDCWWGIVEGWTPQKYEWSGYRELFTIVREFQLKLQVVLTFNECGGIESSGVMVSLPQWVMEVGKENPDIFFTDREGRRNTESLSWGVDKERVLKGRTGLEVYFDFMRSFRSEFDDLFAEGLISAVHIGLGASGELKYPSFSERMGWRYPGIGEFQCYDKYSLQNLQKAATLRGHSFWGRVPDNAGQYNSRPHETGFFCEQGDYDSYYGRFFLRWYSQTLIDHADNVLSFATLVFEDITLTVKVPQVYWWYKTSSHAAELTAGYYNSTNQDGYSPLFEVLKKHSVVPEFVFSELQIPCQDVSWDDPAGLSWQVINSAWERRLSVAGQNANPCCDREAFLRIVETAKPRDHPDQCHFMFFVYQLVSSPLNQGTTCFSDLDYFVKCMHGELEP